LDGPRAGAGRKKRKQKKDSQNRAEKNQHMAGIDFSHWKIFKEKRLKILDTFDCIQIFKLVKLSVFKVTLSLLICQATYSQMCQPRRSRATGSVPHSLKYLLSIRS